MVKLNASKEMSERQIKDDQDNRPTQYQMGD